MKEFFLKKFGGLPVWAWALIGAGGIGAGILLIRWQQSKGTPASDTTLTSQSTPDLTTGNTGQETAAANTVGDNGIINNPFPETNVNGSQVPVVPPGYTPVYDNNGNIVGWAPTSANSSNTGSSTGTGFTATTIMIRGKTPVDPVDGKQTSVPFWSSPGGSKMGSIPFGSAIQQIAAIISGPVNKSASGAYQSSQWYPVSYGGQTGYVSAIDVGGSGTGSTTLQPLARKSTGL